MTSYRRATAAALLGLALGACASRTTEGPSFAPPPPPVASGARDPEGVWRWYLDAAKVSGGLEGPAVTAPTSLPGGLRVAVVPAASVPSTASTSVLAEGAPTPVPVGRGRWSGAAYRSPWTLDPSWDGAAVEIDWLVTAKAHGCDMVDVTAVPRLRNADRCEAVLTEFSVHALLSLGDAIVIVSDPSSGAPETGRLLVGAAAGKTGRLVLRVRG